MIRRIVEVSPLLKGEARITADKIVFPAFDATITAIASDAASAAGGNPVISCFDELWGYISERATRLWDELITSPARKISCRLTMTYAGFSGESVLLEELYKRGMALPEIGPSLACWRWHVVLRGTPSRSRRGRTSAGWRRCGAVLRPCALPAHDHEPVRVAGEQVRRSGGVGCVACSLRWCR